MSVRALVQDERDLLEPFLTRVGDALVNPLTEQALRPADPEFAIVDALVRGTRRLGGLDEAARAPLRAGGWLIAPRPDWDRRARLVFVSLEAHSVCNQSCVFCPVSVAPRLPQQMTLDQYGRIVDQLATHRATLRAVFMNNYNEPTADRGFVNRCASCGPPACRRR